MLQVNNLIGFGAGGVSGEVLIVPPTTSTYTDPSNLTTYTFSACDFGTPSNDRMIVTCIYGSGTNASTQDNCTIGGVSATEIVADQSVGDENLGMWGASVPSGATGDVVITFSATKNRVGICNFIMTGAGNIVASDTDSQTSITDPETCTVTVPANGGLIAAANAENGPSCTWTNATEETELNLGVGRTLYAAYENYVTLQSGLIVTADFASAPTSGNMLCAAWGP